MSRYTLLLLLNLPFIVAGLLNAIVNHKMHKTSSRRFALQLLFWAIVLTGLLTAEPLYNFLFSSNFTATEPLSLFDVVQITGIVTLIYIVNRSRAKLDILERRVQDLHQELSIRLSKDKD